MRKKIRGKIKQMTVRKAVSGIIGMIPAVLFVVFLYVMMIQTFTGEVKDTVRNTTLSSAGFEVLSDSFEDELENNFYDKDTFINLNGLTTRTLGIHTLNERQLLTNGHLNEMGNRSYKEQYSDSVIELNDFLSERGIEFVYVLAPNKLAFYEEAFAPGYTSNAGENADTMNNVLKEAGVTTINMNAWYEEHGWTMDDVYYKTDHHWKTQAAMEAVRATMELFEDRGWTRYDRALLNEDNWKITVYKNWFLGSIGRRTGTKYGGIDDILLYQPDFATNYSYSYLKENRTTWNYADTLLDMDYLDEPDYFNESPYSLYMGGDFPNRITTNTKAANDQRILLMGDSFDQPYEYFLTTQFQEVYTIDLRHCTDGTTLVQYVEEFQPDIVIMCTRSIGANPRLFEFGVSDYEDALAKTDPNALAVELGDFAVEADEGSNEAFTIVRSNLKAGQTYTLTLDSTSYSGGDGHHIQMTLQDLSSNTAIVNRYFDADSEEEQKWIFSVPETADSCVLYLYAGTKGTTANISAEVSDLCLYEGIIE